MRDAILILWDIFSFLTLSRVGFSMFVRYIRKMEKTQTVIETLFRKYYQQMYRLASICLHNEEEGKDAVSDVFARLMQKGRRTTSDLSLR